MNIFEQVRISKARATFRHARIDLKIREILEKFTLPVGQRFWKHFWTISCLYKNFFLFTASCLFEDFKFWMCEFEQPINTLKGKWRHVSCFKKYTKCNTHFMRKKFYLRANIFEVSESLETQRNVKMPLEQSFLNFSPT